MILPTFINNIKEGDVIFDIGSMFGDYALEAIPIIKEKGLVYAFEPAPENFGYLKQNTDKFKNVIAENKAVLDKNEEIDFYLNGQSFYHRTYNNSHVVQTIKSQAVSLDYYFRNDHGGVKVPINFIVMDTPGSEDAIIQGALKVIEKNKPQIMMLSFNPVWIREAGYTAQRCLDTLQGLGYTLDQIGPDGNLLGKTMDYLLDEATGTKSIYAKCQI